jgi:ABC-2 type transport system permease protein
MRRIDYFLGKLGIIVAFLGMVMIVPAVTAYILGMLFSLDITILRDTFPILLASIAYGLIISVSAGLLVLAMSALSRNSRYVALAWVAIWFVSGITASILQQIDSQQRRFAYYNQISIPPPDYRKDLTRQERNLQMQQWSRAQQNAMAQYEVVELDYSKNDWRPLVSYVGNLSRIGQLLLRTDDTWKDIGQFQPDPQTRDQFIAQHMGPQYPWYWSAGVLAGLFVLSTCILNLSIKSLDRLK